MIMDRLAKNVRAKTNNLQKLKEYRHLVLVNFDRFLCVDDIVLTAEIQKQNTMT